MYDMDEYGVVGEAPPLANFERAAQMPQVTPLTALNGTQSDGLRLRVRTATVKLTGDYTGFWATMRLNPRRGVLDRIKSDDIKASCAGYAELIIAWNITDEDGQPVEPTGENFYDLPDDMMGQLVSGYFAQFNNATTVPKP